MAQTTQGRLGLFWSSRLEPMSWWLSAKVFIVVPNL
jgi:hypothetical protein